MATVLLVGNGAREHAIAEALARSSTIIAFAKTTNPGIAKLAARYELGSHTDTARIVALALETKCNFAVIGPEDPLVAGVADALWDAGVPVVGPRAACAQLEGSKSFTRDLLTKYQIPGNPKCATVMTADDARAFMTSLGGNFVVKADGLKGGKGVKVSGDHLHSIDEGAAYAAECISEVGKVVIEEKLIGQEFSLLSFVDGETVVDMPIVQDHKRAYEGDTGPNTGGMGTYTDANHLLPFLTEKDRAAAHAINVAVARAIREETGVPYQGILYGGFMATKHGVQLIEYNVRFGDPEAMNVLTLLETDFTTVCEAIIMGTLAETPVAFSHHATVCKYVVPEGYPDHPVSNQKITIGALLASVHLFYASVDERIDGLYLGASRALAFVGIGDTIAQAEAFAQSAVTTVEGPVFHRKDIGTQALIDARVTMMHALRG